MKILALMNNRLSNPCHLPAHFTVRMRVTYDCYTTIYIHMQARAHVPFNVKRYRVDLLVATLHTYCKMSKGDLICAKMSV